MNVLDCIGEHLPFTLSDATNVAPLSAWLRTAIAQSCQPTEWSLRARASACSVMHFSDTVTKHLLVTQLHTILALHGPANVTW